MEYSMMELVPVVRKLTEKYTGKESTSVTYEAAEQLMGAVIFCINEYFEGSMNEGPEAKAKEGRTLGGAGKGGALRGTEEAGKGEVLNGVGKARESEADDSGEIWKHGGKLPAEEAYKKGYQAVMAKVMRTKSLYEEIVADFEWYGNRALYETVVKGMPQFFLRYDAQFNPQDHLLTLDYPILKWSADRCGVDIIYDYLDGIRLEQRFLAGFSKEAIVTVLNQYHPDYKNLFINLAGAVAQKTLEKMLSDDFSAMEKDKDLAKKKKQLALELLIGERYEKQYGNPQEIVQYLLNDLCCP